MLERILATARDDQRRERWEERTNLPLLILAAAMLPILLVQFLANVDQRTDDWLELASWLIWAVFAVDLGVRFWFAEQRRRFLIRNWIDVLIVAIPFLRPLRLLRIVIVLARIWRLLDRRGVRGTVLLAVVIMAGATAAVWVVERNAGGEVHGWDSALWWTLHTMATGDGVKAAETVAGRVLGVVVTLLGFALLGLMTATIAAWFVEQEQDVEQEQILDELKSLQAEVKALRENLPDDRPRSE